MNNTIFFFFYNFAHRGVLLDDLIIFFAVYFPYIVILMAGIFLLFYRKSLKDFFWVFLSAGIAVIMAEILKSLIHTERPFVVLKNVHSLFAESSLAFPSGHATFFSALAMAIFFYHKKAGYYFILFALLIGLARIIAGVHFPIDILGGFILGASIAFFVKKL